jgi:predicted N-formylglutamate amidohydrolase
VIDKQDFANHTRGIAKNRVSRRDTSHFVADQRLPTGNLPRRMQHSQSLLPSCPLGLPGKPMSLLISCEVGGNEVPEQLIDPALRDLQQAKTRTHTPTLDLASPVALQHHHAGASLGKRGTSKRSRKKLRPGKLPVTLSHDEPAAYVAQRLADKLQVPLVLNRYSPDLIDVTHSLHHRSLFPPQTRAWAAEYRQQLVETIYEPHRSSVRKAIQAGIDRFGYLIHLSTRTFDIQKNRKIQRADAGLLYDPACEHEVDLCLDLVDELYEEVPMLRVRRNYPGRGTTDRLTKAMRAEFADENYFGIELMLNRAWVGRPLPIRDEVIDGIAWTLQLVAELEQSEAA